MKYLSVCSGIEAATVAWHPLGWSPVAFSEIEKFPSAVLAHHYPDVPNLGDMTRFKEWPDATVDVLVGGTPCQSFSVAGLRQGMDDPRGNLALTYLAIAERYRPRWLVWENVTGVLSSSGGRDFGSFLGALVELGYGFAYRVLDAQYFGLAQRRKRVFVVGCLGGWAAAAAVLFERESLSGHPAPSREAGQGTTGATTEGAGKRWPAEVAGTLDAHYGDKMELEDQHIFNQNASRFVSAFDPNQITSKANRSQPKPEICHTLPATSIPPIAFAMRQREGCAGGGKGPLLSEEQSLTLATNNDQTVFAPTPINTQLGLRGDSTSNTPREGVGVGNPGDPAFTLQATHHHAVQSGMAVRRLTPVECERLQGFPDNYTAIPWRNKPAEECPDGPRYKALGNSMAVPCMAWIGNRIAQVSAIKEAA